MFLEDCFTEGEEVVVGEEDDPGLEEVVADLVGRCAEPRPDDEAFSLLLVGVSTGVEAGEDEVECA